MSVEDMLVQDSSIDTDLAPPFGRFANAEQQERAANLYTRA